MSDPPDRRFDLGLQPERTGLAWRRTASSLAVGSLVALRVLPAIHPVWWALAPGAAGLAVAVAMVICSHLRYRRMLRVLDGRPPFEIADGCLPTVAAAGVGLLAVVALGVLIVSEVDR